MGMTKDNIISHKDTQRLSPPDILLTNCKMLDYLLFRSRIIAGAAMQLEKSNSQFLSR